MATLSTAQAPPRALRVLMLLDKPFRTDLRLEREIRALVRAGHFVRLLCEAEDGRPMEETWEGAEIRRFRTPRDRVRRWLFYLLATMTGRNAFWQRWVPEAAQGAAFDVVHCHDLPIALTGVRFARQTGALVIFDRHEDWPGLLEGLRAAFRPGLKRALLWNTINSPSVWRRWERRVLRAADLVITVSREAAASLPERPRGDVAVVSNYVDLEALPPLCADPPQAPPLRLCFIGVFNAMFALRETLEAVALLPRGAVHVTLVGEGDDLPLLQEAVGQLDLGEHVSFTGWRPRDEALAAVGRSHLGLLPLRENRLTRTTVGNKMFEYMGLGRGVLASGVGVMSRMVAESGGGVIVDPWEARTVARTLRRLIDSPADVSALGRRARAAVLSRYNWANERGTFLAAYATLAARRRCE